MQNPPDPEFDHPDDAEPSAAEPAYTWYVSYDAAPESWDDDVTTGEAELTWWQRRKLRRSLKREERIYKGLVKAARKEVNARAKASRKSEQRKAKAHAKAVRVADENPTLQAAYQVMTQIAQEDRHRVDAKQARLNAANAIRQGFTAMYDRQFRYFAFVGTWLTALVIALLATCSCAALKPHYPTLPGEVRALQTQFMTTVAVDVDCLDVAGYHGGRGSATILDARHVLTAYHVVACGDIPEVKIALADGRTFKVVVKHENVKLDFAVLELASADLMGSYAPPRFGHVPDPGDVVCASAAVPRREWNCGPVGDVNGALAKQYLRAYGLPRTLFGDVGFSAFIQPGNSGGPIYNEFGEIVGITVEVGRFRSLESNANEILGALK
jgi:S1-C subfamily serine protease